MVIFVQCGIDEFWFVVVKEGIGDFDIFIDYDFGWDIIVFEQFEFFRVQNCLYGCIQLFYVLVISKNVVDSWIDCCLIVNYFVDQIFKEVFVCFDIFWFFICGIEMMIVEFLDYIFGIM